MENQANVSSTTATQQDPESSQSSSVSSSRSSRSSTQRKSILKTADTLSASSKSNRANTKKENSSASSSSIPSPSPSSNSNSDHVSVTPSVSFADQTSNEIEVKKSPVRTRTTRQSLSKANNNNNNNNNNNTVSATTPNKNSSQNGKPTRTPSGRNSKNNNKKLEEQKTPIVEVKEEEKEQGIIKDEEITTKKKKSPMKKTPVKEEEPAVKFFCPNDENTLDGFNNKEDSNSLISNDDTNLEEINSNNTNTIANKKSSIKITKLDKNFTQAASVGPPSSNTESSNNTQSNDGLETGDDATNQVGGEQNGEYEDQSQNSGDQFKKKRRRRTSILINESSGGQISAANLFVYKWPQPDGEPEKSDPTNAAASSEQPENYILQEQFSEYLGIKSFKRKFPDLFRRLIDVKEREYLKENKVVTETQCDLGLTALKLNECLDIMADNYPDKYKELNDLLYEKRRKNYMKNIDAHLNESETTLTTNNTNASSTVATPATKPRPGRVAMSEADRMKEMIKKAMKSVSNYNLQLQKEKKEERNLYFDLQTMRIQKPLGQMNRNIQVKYINPNGQYPVSVLPGQYQNYYKKYSSDELKYLPLNTVVYAPPVPAPLLYEEWKQQQNQLGNQSKQNENGTKNESSDDETANDRMDSYVEQQTPQQINKPKLPQSNKIANILANSSLNISANNTSSSFKITCSAAPTVANLINNKQTSSASTTPSMLPKKVITPIYKECNVCGKTSQINAGASVDQFMIGCSSCSRYSHPNCLELNPSLVNWQCIMQYDWQCMECKRCTKCNNPHDEDKMMFCDRCDRGYHTYCVGLKDVPTGTWLCKTCDGPLAANENENLASLINSPSKQKLALLKPRLNASLNESLTPSSTGVRTGKRGRPPGSLNKPKDPNSPKKQAKGLIKKLKMDSSLTGNGTSRDDESMDGYGDMDDELSNNISIENINNLINISMNDRLVHSNY